MCILLHSLILYTTQFSFKVMDDGTIFVSSVIDPAIKNVILPKIGYVLEMPEGFENFTWFGRGPWDSYADRKEACFEGVYNSTVAEQWTGYVLPQEMGNKEEVRWMGITDTAGCLVYRSGEDVCFSSSLACKRYVCQS